MTHISIYCKSRLILDEMYRLYGKFASYLRRVLCNAPVKVKPAGGGGGAGHGVGI